MRPEGGSKSRGTRTARAAGGILVACFCPCRGLGCPGRFLKNRRHAAIAPHELGQFELSYADKLKLTEPLSSEQSSLLYSLIPSNLDSYCVGKGLVQTGAACLSKHSPEGIKQRVAESALPHSDFGDEVHVCFAGSLVFYFQTEHQLALVLQPGEWIFIKADCPVWVKPTEDYFFSFVSYHADKRDPLTKNYVECFDKKIL